MTALRQCISVTIDCCNLQCQVSCRISRQLNSGWQLLLRLPPTPHSQYVRPTRGSPQLPSKQARLRPRTGCNPLLPSCLVRHKLKPQQRQLWRQRSLLPPHHHSTLYPFMRSRLLPTIMRQRSRQQQAVLAHRLPLLPDKHLFLCSVARQWTTRRYSGTTRKHPR